MIRSITRPSTARCTLPMYIGFLLSEPNGTSCSRLASVLSISHDSVNRFLYRESYSAKDLYDEVAPTMNLNGGALSVDDSVLDKPRAQYIALTGYYWSGKHHRVVKGINLITLYYTDVHGQHQPISFRVYDKADKKTKNDYFLEMLGEVLKWGLEPAFVTGDSWYSCVKNHLFAAICGYVELQRLRAMELIANCYRLRRELFNDVIRAFIGTFIEGRDHLNPKFQGTVNA